VPNFISYGKQWIDDDDIAAVVAVLKSDFLTQGPAVEAFEAELVRLTGARFCVSFCNATAALQAAVWSLQLGEGEGITSPNTFLASANCLAYNGLKPVFADIDSQTYNLDPAEVEAQLTSKSKVLVPVHFAGQAADMPAFQRLAERHDLRIIEDAAHAIGSRYPGGRPVGCCDYSDLTVFSFHPVKTITTGEGGAVTTNDARLAKRLQLFRSHGIERSADLMTQNPGPWYHEMVDLGYNLRLTDLQAALGTSQLTRLEAFKARRKAIIARYNEAFAELPGFTVPHEAAGNDSCFHLYVTQIDFPAIGKDRLTFMSGLKAQGVGTQVHYIPVHTQPYYQQTWGYRPGDYPRAEAYYAKALSLPLFPKMSNLDVERVIEAVKNELEH